MPENLLAIDNGTQSVRALLFDPRGNLLAKHRVPIESYYSTAPGLAEQDPDVFWRAVCEACQGLWAQSVDKSSIAAVALTTQRSTVINVDENGKPLRPAIVWLDQRRTEGLKPVGGLWGAAFAVAGASQTVAYLQAEAECNWIRTHQPQIWNATHKYLLLSGYLTYRLVGQFVDSVSSQVAYIPFDYKAQAWSKWWDWKWQAVPMDKRILPDLVPVASPLGQISAEASSATGIPQGLPLIAAAADKATEVLGAGCLEPHIGCLSYGTTVTINTTHKKYIEVIPLLPPYPAAVPGQYSFEIQVQRGYWMVTWFKHQFGLREQKLADERGIEPEALFDELVHSVPPGSDGLVLQPYWSPGLRFPGPEARGAIIGFSDVHTRAHMYRAILEGLAYAMREGAERTAKRSGIPVTELRVAGGGSQSTAALQLTADVFGLPASRPHIYEASGLGAAMDAAVGVGVHNDFPTAIREMTRVRDTFEPDFKTHARYNDLYHGVYKKMYERLRPLYQFMRSVE
ncbi:MAG TPA: FGGY-family carbohydrate kinase [Anaerolineales bacterium]|nr:FGGY-family carbohydrate kinase [Anaerolineales bacterium]